MRQGSTWARAMLVLSALATAVVSVVPAGGAMRAARAGDAPGAARAGASPGTARAACASALGLAPVDIVAPATAHSGSDTVIGRRGCTFVAARAGGYRARLPEGAWLIVVERAGHAMVYRAGRSRACRDHAVKAGDRVWVWAALEAAAGAGVGCRGAGPVGGP